MCSRCVDPAPSLKTDVQKRAEEEGSAEPEDSGKEGTTEAAAGEFNVEE